MEEMVTATGWGLDSFNGSNTNDLMKVKLELFSHNECQEALRIASNSSVTITEAQICAGSRLSSKDTCAVSVPS